MGHDELWIVGFHGYHIVIITGMCTHTSAAFSLVW